MVHLCGAGRQRVLRKVESSEVQQNTGIHDRAHQSTIVYCPVHPLRLSGFVAICVWYLCIVLFYAPIPLSHSSSKSSSPSLSQDERKTKTRAHTPNDLKKDSQADQAEDMKANILQRKHQILSGFIVLLTTQMQGHR